MTETTITTTPAAEVRSARARLNMTQAELAVLLEMDRGRLSGIENDKIRDLRVSEAAAIHRVLGIPLDAWVAVEGEEEG